RFAIGAKITVKETNQKLTVASTRWHLSRLLIKFEEIQDRTAVDSVRGKTLVVEVDPNIASLENNEFYEFQLVDLEVFNTNNEKLGVVKEVLPGSAQALIVVKTLDNKEVMVPFVNQLVPVVDVKNKKVVMDPPIGLFDEENAEDAR
ncbi:MAG: ribosome maturation factor RimM, partial [Candidatus Nanopelagicales bacterium]